MTMFLICLIIFVGCIAILVIQAKARKKLKLRGKELGAEMQMYVNHMEGLPLSQHLPISLFACNDKILAEAGDKRFEFPIERIVMTKAVTEQEVIESNKSVVGRAVIGGLLTGGLGAIIGGMSGVGTKKKKGKTEYYYIVNYRNKENEVMVISFKILPLNMFAGTKFANIINNQVLALSTNTESGTIVL